MQVVETAADNGALGHVDGGRFVRSAAGWENCVSNCDACHIGYRWVDAEGLVDYVLQIIEAFYILCRDLGQLKHLVAKFAPCFRMASQVEEDIRQGDSNGIMPYKVRLAMSYYYVLYSE